MLINASPGILSNVIVDANGNLYCRLPGSDTTYNLLRTQPKSAIGSGGKISADGDLHVGACTLLGLIVTTAGTAGTIDISDATGANGTSLFQVASGAINSTVYLPLPGITFGVGVRADFTTLVGNCTAIVGPAI